MECWNDGFQRFETLLIILSFLSWPHYSNIPSFHLFSRFFNFFFNSGKFPCHLGVFFEGEEGADYQTGPIRGPAAVHAAGDTCAQSKPFGQPGGPGAGFGAAGTGFHIFLDQFPVLRILEIPVRGKTPRFHDSAADLLA
jgi:hypothetical protein